MIDKFISYLTKECQFTLGQKVLVALSGGADSVVLLHLLHKCKVDIIAAHCNFNLRGEESDGDELFVKQLCKELCIKLHVKSFDTKEHAADKGISIEMAARELRYSWFKEIMATEKLDLLATGHHKDDSIETFFLNLARGTGIKGLTGIKPVNEKIIRPLLCFTRQQIEIYCIENNLKYKTDSSNLESVYMRNKVRNNILPIFNEINPSFTQTMMDNMSHLEQVSLFFQATIEDIKDEMVVDQNGILLISLRHVNSFTNKELVLFEILHPYGFNGAVIKELVVCIDSEVSGKQFYSADYRLIKDRFNLLLLPKEELHGKELFYINVDESTIDKPIQLKIEADIDINTFEIDKRKTVAQFDTELLEYPLTLRKWKQGDQFCPLGMGNFKKLSDFFIDSKFSLKDKEDVWLLLSGEDIIWIVGHRTDDRYKITNKTKSVTKFTWV